jgi:heme oxygenase
MYSAMFAGGQILRSWFNKAFRLQGLDGTRAYGLSETIPDREQFQKRYNCALNDLDLSRDDKETIFKQRLEIFHLNSTLFEEIRESTEYKARVRKCLLVIVLLLLALYVLYTIAKSR